MLDKIKLLNGRTVIDFRNPAAERLYGIDSLNLIIGDNGSGKTALIKSIVKDLTSDRSAKTHVAVGKTDRLGVIYYTAAPFHKEMAGSSNNAVEFLDVSKSESKRQNFLNVAVDYIEAAEKLKIEHKLHSVVKYDFTETALGLIEAFRSVSGLKSRPNFSSNILEHLKEADKLRHRHKILTAQKMKEERRWYEASSEDRKEIDLMLSVLETDIERLARESKDRLNQLVDRFIYECGAKTGVSVARWIVASHILKQTSSPAMRRELAQRIYEGNFSEIENSSLANLWNPAIKTVSDFIRFLSRNLPQSYNADRSMAVFSIDVAALLKLKNSVALIESANKFGLLDVGFDRISSGEAAILHQMTSIVHGIQQLARGGKKSFLIFIDEGDLLLHIRWQQQYLELLTEKLSAVRAKLELRSIQLVVATHSPMLATDVLKGSITRLKARGTMPSFGAPLQKIVNYSFGTTSLGNIASKTIAFLRNKTRLDAVESHIADNIDDDFIREYILHQEKR